MMKVALPIPSVKDLEKAYQQLMYHSPETSTAKELALYANWSRFDPRLAEILVTELTNEWNKIDPLKFRQELLCTPWPTTAAVLLEFVKVREKKNPSLFKNWRSLVLTGVKKAPDELFFFGLRTIGSEAMQNDAEYASLEYKKWGYLARENLCPKNGRLAYSKETRMRLLKTLFNDSPFVRPKDYWTALDKSISLRQAERDMNACRFLKSTGNTKARRYSLK